MTTLATTPHIRYGAGPVCPDDLLELTRYFIQCLLPGDALKLISNALERELQSLRVILKIGNVRSLSAKITL